MPNSNWQDKRVLVTGCAGFLGSWLTAQLVLSGAEVVGIIRDRVPNSQLSKSGTINHIAVVNGDVCDYELVERDIAAIARACHAGNAILKVIIEAAMLTDEEKVAASQLAKVAGADFVKTSTGFGPGGATPEDVALMRRVVGPKIGVKAAGGIRTYDDAQKMIAAGANRIGASASVKIIEGANK